MRPRGLAAIDGVSRISHDQHPLGIRTTLLATHTALAEAVAAVSAAGPTDLAVHPPSLEQLFLEHYQDRGADQGAADSERVA